jgi:hypothetical protein
MRNAGITQHVDRSDFQVFMDDNDPDQNFAWNNFASTQIRRQTVQMSDLTTATPPTVILLVRVSR